MSDSDSDALTTLSDQICEAYASRRPLAIVGGNSKSRLSHPAVGERLDTTQHRGIVRYEPTELYLRARAGTSMQLIMQTLAAHRQQLPFDPPQVDGATLGGIMALGLSGPSRPWTGSARDHVLGVDIIDGQGQHLRFGGDMIKNVAGYDVSRLQVGAWGTLGVIVEVSLKVVPMPEDSASVRLPGYSNEPAVVPSALLGMRRQPWPLSGLWVDAEQSVLRFSGSTPAVDTAVQKLVAQGATRVENDAADRFWQHVRDGEQVQSNAPGVLWRIALPNDAKALDVPGQQWLDWGGAQRWLHTTAKPSEIFAAAAERNGHALRYSAPSTGEAVFQPLPENIIALQRELRRRFDPLGLFNRERAHPDLALPSASGELR